MVLVLLVTRTEDLLRNSLEETEHKGISGEGVDGPFTHSKGETSQEDTRPS